MGRFQFNAIAPVAADDVAIGTGSPADCVPYGSEDGQTSAAVGGDGSIESEANPVPNHGHVDTLANGRTIKTTERHTGTIGIRKAEGCELGLASSKGKSSKVIEIDFD